MLRDLCSCTFPRTLTDAPCAATGTCRFGPKTEVEAERRFIADKLQQEEARRPRAAADGGFGELSDERAIRAGMKRCRRRLQLEMRVAELELQLDLQTRRGADDEDAALGKGQRDAAVPEAMMVETDSVHKDGVWDRAAVANAHETLEADENLRQPQIVVQTDAVVLSPLPAGLMKELESTISALHSELEGRDLELQRLQKLVDDRNHPPISSDQDISGRMKFAASARNSEEGRDCEAPQVAPRTPLRRRNKLLRVSWNAWMEKVLRHRNAVYCEHRFALTQKARIVQAWHSHLSIQNASR